MMAAFGMAWGSLRHSANIHNGPLRVSQCLDRKLSAPDISQRAGRQRTGSKREIIMRRFMRHSAFLAVLLGLALALPTIAHATVVAKIDLSSQRMTVFVDGKQRYKWRVSTARPGYRTPTGTFRPTALVRYHRSTIYDGSPMPYSIFFLRGYAIHGSYEIKHLGRPASHGCVRLHPSNAAALYSLVKQYGTGNTLIKISY
jgi:L,D-transpeptidase catalytic domain